MTGISELGFAVRSAAPEQVRVSVVGGRTQLDVALPVDIPIATLLPELIRLVRSRDVEASTDTAWSAPRDGFWILSRLDPQVSLAPDDTLRAAGVLDGELLQLTDKRELPAPTLYDDVVDAAAQLNRAAYASWDAAAARWMSFAGIAMTSLIWMYLLLNAPFGAQHASVVGVGATVAAAMLGAATLAHRSYGRADIAAALGWAAIGIGATVLWVLLRRSGAYGLAAGSASMVVLDAACYRVIGTGRWGYLATGVLFTGSALAMLGHALGASAQIVGVALAVTGALTCLAVPQLTAGLVRVEPLTSRRDHDRETLAFEDLLPPQPIAPDSAVKIPSTPVSAAMPTAEAVWAKVRAAAAIRSAVYAGLAGCVVCGVTTVLRDEAALRWAALVFAAHCAAALGVHAARCDGVGEKVSLGVPALALAVGAALRAQDCTTAIGWAGLATLLAAAVLASAAGLTLSDDRPGQRWTVTSTYLQYATYAALLPVALWTTGFFQQLEIR